MPAPAEAEDATGGLDEQASESAAHQAETHTPSAHHTTEPTAR